jgi:hypothetical protein
MTNNKQQTALDWLIKEHFGGIENCTPDFRHKIKQAKAMHREEHFNTWWHSISENEPITFEQYYNKTYTGGEQ